MEITFCFYILTGKGMTPYIKRTTVARYSTDKEEEMAEEFADTYKAQGYECMEVCTSKKTLKRYNFK